MFACSSITRAGAFLALFVAVINHFGTSLNAVEWNQYRGPTHDGVCSEIIRTNWNEQPPRLVWKVPLNYAFSSFAVGGGRAFTQALRSAADAKQESCVALDADTGAELWATQLGIGDYPNGGAGSDDGPRSTPTLDAGRVYVLTSYLRMVCLDATSGQEIWSKDLVAEFGGTVIAWQNAASPLVVDDLIFMNCNAPGGRLLALQKSDGAVAWRRYDDRMTQATPILATIHGVAQIIFFAQSGLVSVVPTTGDVLWRYAFRYSVSTAASPVVADDVVYCSAAYGVGAGAVQISGDAGGLSTKELWRTVGANMNHWATPVAHAGNFFSVSGHTLYRLSCVEAVTGNENWVQTDTNSGGSYGLGGVLKVMDRILLLTTKGDLVLVDTNPSAYLEAARFRAVNGKCWNVPAISDGRIYVRSTTEAAAYDVSVSVTPKPRLKLFPGANLTGAFQFFIGNEDDSPLDAARAGNISVLASTNLSLGQSAWGKFSAAPIFTNGQLRVDDPAKSNLPSRFFRAEENP